MRELTIETSGKKGRVFRATLLASVEADSLWSGGETDTQVRRPVWMMLAASDAEMRPFVANLQSGRKAEWWRHGHRNYGSADARYELLRSAGYQYTTQRTEAGSIVTACLPDLFRLDPGMVDPAGASFVLLPAESWLLDRDTSRERAHLEALGVPADHEGIDLVLRLAPLFIAYLDRRTRCPIVPDHRFYAQVLFAALSTGLAVKGSPNGRARGSWGHEESLGYVEHDVASVGLVEGVAFMSAHPELETFLAAQVRIYDEAISG